MNETFEVFIQYPHEREDGWYVRALFGPFLTKEEADDFVCRSDYLEMSKEAPSLTRFTETTNTSTTLA